MYERLGRKNLLVQFFYTEYFVRHYTLLICDSIIGIRQTVPVKT
jgi:hypothetical protein